MAMLALQATLDICGSAMNMMTGTQANVYPGNTVTAAAKEIS
jgi:hypothetical protein